MPLRKVNVFLSILMPLRKFNVFLRILTVLSFFSIFFQKSSSSTGTSLMYRPTSLPHASLSSTTTSTPTSLAPQLCHASAEESALTAQISGLVEEMKSSSAPKDAYENEVHYFFKMLQSRVLRRLNPDQFDTLSSQLTQDVSNSIAAHPKPNVEKTEERSVDERDAQRGSDSEHDLI